MAQLVIFTVLSVAALAKADSVERDLSTGELATLGARLHCQRRPNEVEKIGCGILDAFSAAEEPDTARLTESASSIAGKRWLGTTVVVSSGNRARGEVKQPSPHLNLLVLGTRFSRNLHQKVYYQNGWAPIYVWPTSIEEIAMIESCARSLQSGDLAPDDPAASFARDVELTFASAQNSAGKSLLLGDSLTFMRQQGDTLYVIETESSVEAPAKVWLSVVRLKHVLAR